MGAPLHSHFSNDTLRFQEDHLFSRTGQAFFSFASFLSFFLSLFTFFFFFGTQLLTLRNLRYMATRLHQVNIFDDHWLKILSWRVFFYYRR